MNKDQVKGAAKDVVGKVQEEAGKLVGSKEQQLNNHRLKPVGLNYGLKVRIRVA